MRKPFLEPLRHICLSRKTTFAALFSAALIAGVPKASQGANYTAAGSGNWSTVTNWAPNGNPDPTVDNFTIGAGRNITVDGGIPAPSSAATIYIKQTGTITSTGVLNAQTIDTSNTSTLTLSAGGTVNYTGALNAGTNTGATNGNVINITGAGSAMYSANNGITSIGYQKGATLNVLNGGLYNATVTGPGEVIIGAGATGVLNVDGSGSQFVANVGTYYGGGREVAVTIGSGTATGSATVTNGGTFTMGATQDVFYSGGLGNAAILDATAQRTLYIGRDTGSTGTFTVGTSAGVGGGTVTNNGTISIGDRGTGTFNMYDGTVTTGVGSTRLGGDVFVGGYVNGGYFAPTPLGNPQTFNRNMIAHLTYGNGGASSIDILHQTGTVYNTNPTIIPYAPDPGGVPGWNQPVTTGVGTFNMDGGTMNVGGVLWAGTMRGSIGTINVTGGNLNINGQFLQQDPGYFPTSTTAGMTIGFYGKGIYNQTGGTVTTGVSGAGGDVQVSIFDNPTSNGTGSRSSLTISGGTLNIGGSLIVGNDSHDNGVAQGDVFFNGGTVYTNEIHYGWGGGDIYYNGTVIKANVDTLNFLDGSSVANSEILSGGGGAIFDTNGHAVSINSILDGPGVLTKQGLGTLTLNNIQTYTGATNVNNGTLLYGTNDVIGSGAVNINRISGSASAILDMGANHNDTVGTVTLDGVFSGGRINGTGTSTLTTTGTFEMKNGTVTAGLGGAGIALNKTTSGTVTLSGTNSYTGLTTVSAGTLTLNNTLSNNTTILTDGVSGTQDILINGGNLLIAASEQIGNTATINMTSGSLRFSGSGKTETIGQLSNSGGTLVTGANTIIGLGPTVTWSGGTNTISSGGAIRDKHWQITGGTNTVQAGGELEVRNGGGTYGLHFGGTSSPTITLDSTAGPGAAGSILLKNDVFVDSSLTSGTAQILNGGALANPGFIDMNGGTRTFDINNGSAATDMLISARIQNGGLTKDNTGTLELSGNNTFAGSTTINGGTLIANGLNSLGGTSDVTVNGGTVLQLAGANSRVNDSAAIVLNGGTLTMQGLSSATETMGTLTLTANSVINFGTGNTNTLIFSDFTMNGFSLAIYGWTGTLYSPSELYDHGPASQDRIEFTPSPFPTLSNADYGRISFYDDAGVWLGTAFHVLDNPAGPGGLNFELVPVPEPTTMLGALSLFGLIGFRERNRYRNFCRQLAKGKAKVGGEI